jgi:hypothetical protein
MKLKNENEDNTGNYFSIKDLFISYEQLKRRQISSWFSILLGLTFILFVTITVTVFISDQDNAFGKPYFNKSIKGEIEKAILNNADIEVIKHIYNNRIIIKPDIILSLFKKSPQEKYLEGTPLSTILSDILADYYLTGKNDSMLLCKVHRIVLVHNQTNPFDKLEANQKNDFENLRLKLGDKFDVIQSDVNRISDELANKNQLVDEYLDKSTLSYWISIAALIATILLSVYQIIQNHPRKVLKLIKSSMDSKNEDNK